MHIYLYIHTHTHIKSESQFPHQLSKDNNSYLTHSLHTHVPHISHSHQQFSSYSSKKNYKIYFSNSLRGDGMKNFFIVKIILLL